MHKRLQRSYKNGTYGEGVGTALIDRRNTEKIDAYKEYLKSKYGNEYEQWVDASKL